MAMSELKQKLLLYELDKIGFRDAQYHPASDRLQIQPDNNRMPVINNAGDIKYGTEYESVANTYATRKLFYENYLIKIRNLFPHRMQKLKERRILQLWTFTKSHFHKKKFYRSTTL